MLMRSIKTYMIKEKLIAVLLCLVMLASIACSSIEPEIETTDEPAITESPMVSITTSPSYGGVLRLPMPENADINNEDYNPLIVNTEEMLQLYSIVYDSMFKIDETNLLEPALAQSWVPDPEVENTWLITLRKEVKWHDGSAFNADDVIYTYNSIYALGSESYYVSTLNNVKRVEKVDEYTLRFTMSMPGMTALYSLNFPIINKNSEVLMGTGAYKLNYIGDSKIVFTANSDWWDRSPYIETIEFYAKSSNETALASYNAGLLDLVPTAQLTVGQYAEEGKTIVSDIMTQNMEVLLINHDKKFCNDFVFRAAIAHSINRSRIITNIYMNRARTCDVPFPPDSWLYDSTQVAYNYNKEVAISMLEDIGFAINSKGNMVDSFKRKLELTLLTSSTTENTTRADAAKLIAEQLGEIGISVNVVTAEHTYGDDESEFMMALAEGDWDMALVGFNLSEGNELVKYLTPEGKNNFGNYNDEEMSRVVAAMNAAKDEESLRNAAYELQKLFVSELPFIVLYFRLNSVVYSAEILGVENMREPLLFRDLENWYLN